MRWNMKMFALTAMLVVPFPAGAQTIATTFERLQTLLEPGDYVVVVDRADLESWGRVVAVSASELTIALGRTTQGGDRLEMTGARRVFMRENVRDVFMSDREGRKGRGIFPASWDLVDALPTSTAIKVFLEGRGGARYRLIEATPAALRVVGTDGSPQVIAKSSVLRVDRDRVDDPSGDGALKGALIGAAVQIGNTAIAYARCERCDAPERKQAYSIGAAYGAGIGALAGWVIDRLHKGSETIFPVVPPALAGRRGVFLAWTF